MVAAQTLPWRRRIRKTIFWTVLSATALLMLLYFAVQIPWFIRLVVLPFLSRGMACSMTAQEVSFSPAAGQMVLKGLRIEDGGVFHFRAEEAAADLSVLALLLGRWEIENADIRDAVMEINVFGSEEVPNTPDDDYTPLAEKNLIPFRIRQGEIRNLTLQYRDERGSLPVQFQTSMFTMRIKNWGIPGEACEVRSSCPFSVQMPGVVTLRGGRAAMAMNASFDGGALPESFSLSLSAGCLVSFDGESRESVQNLILHTEGKVNREGKVDLDSFSLQQQTGGAKTASIFGSGSFGPALDSFSVQIRQLRTLPQFWAVAAPLAGYPAVGKVTLDGQGDWEMENGARSCNFSFSGKREAGNGFPGMTFRWHGQVESDLAKKQTRFSALQLDVQEIDGQGKLQLSLIKPATYCWESGIGGAAVNLALRKMPLNILRGLFRDEKSFPVRSGECSGNFRGVIRKDLNDCGMSGMLSFSHVVLCAGNKDFAPLSSEMLMDVQGFRIKKCAGSILSGRRELLRISIQGECGKKQESGAFLAKGKFNAEDLLHFYRREKLSIGPVKLADFSLSGKGGKQQPLHLRAMLSRVPFRLLELPGGCQAKSGMVQATLSLDRDSVDEPGRFALSISGSDWKFRQGGTLHHWSRTDIAGRGEIGKDDRIRFQGNAFAKSGKRKLLDFGLEAAEYAPAQKKLNGTLRLRRCDIGGMPLPSDGVVTKGIVSGKSELNLSPTNWRAQGTFQAENLSGAAKLPADGRGSFQLSGDKDTFELSKLSLQFQSREKEVLALTANGKLNTRNKGSLELDSSMLDLDFLKRFCDDSQKGPAALVQTAKTPCRISNPYSGRFNLNFRKVCMGRAYGTLKCGGDLAPGKISIRDYALSLGGEPIRGNVFLENVSEGVHCRFLAGVARPMELRPLLQFFVPESLQGMRCQLEKMRLISEGTLRQWDSYLDSLPADLDAKFGECVIPNSFGNGKIGRVLLMPFEAINRTTGKVSADDKRANESFWETMQGVQRAVQTIKFTRGIGKVKLRGGTVYLQTFHFKGDLIQDFRITGKMQLNYGQLLALQTNTSISGMDFPVYIGGTLNAPAVQPGKTTTDIVVKNTGNLLNSLGNMVKDKVDWDTTLQ